MTKEITDKLKEEIKKDQQLPEKKKPFKIPWGKRQVMNKSLKKPDMVLVFLLNLKKNIEGPILTKIYGGNFFVIRNHVYRFKPDKVFSWGRYKAVIAREFDRELVGIEDYQEVVNEGGERTNINDPVIIKAIIQAKLAEKPQVSAGKWIWIVALIAAAIVAFLIFGGGGNKPPAEVPAG